MKKIVIPALSILFLAGCQPKKKNEFFPVLSYLQSQVKQVDTSVYGIQKIITIDSLSDTTAIRREDFRKEAADFLDIPDLTEGRFTNKYEEKKDFDQDLNQVTLSYYPLGKNQPVLREEVSITPAQAGDDQVNSIYIEKMKEGRDSTIIKKMLWRINESFKIVTIIQKEAKPDTIIEKEIIWNKPADE